MTQNEFRNAFWKQYLLLEKDFLETDEYVSIESANNSTFSSRYTYLFLNICSEVDSLAEEICKHITVSAKPKNILEKLTAIVDNNPKIKDQHVITKYPYKELNFVPFQNFSASSAAGWWKDYNQVKHFRADCGDNGVPNYQKANLKNVMYSLAGLYVLGISLFDIFDDSGIILEESKLFREG